MRNQYFLPWPTKGLGGLLPKVCKRKKGSPVAVDSGRARLCECQFATQRCTRSAHGRMNAHSKKISVNPEEQNIAPSHAHLAWATGFLYETS